MQRPSPFVALVLFLCIWTVAAQDDCAPATWSKGSISRRQPMALSHGPSPKRILASEGILPGQINCRYSARTSSSVNYYTCFQMATRYAISVDLLLQLNPTLDPDCANVEPKTDYCVAGCEYCPNDCTQDLMHTSY